MGHSATLGPQFLHLKSTGVVLGYDATEPPLTSSCPLPDTFPWPPLSSLSKHSSLIGGGPPPQLPLLLAPCEVCRVGPQGPAVLGSFSGAISHRPWRWPQWACGQATGSQDSARLWPAVLPQARGSPLPVVGRQIPRQSHFHFCTL